LNQYKKPHSQTLEPWVSLPLSQTRKFEQKGIPDTVKDWLLKMVKSNWKKCVLRSVYTIKTKRGVVIKKIIWRLPNTLPKRMSCSTFRYLGCMHHGSRMYLVARRLSCFRAVCEACGLLKWLPRESNRVTARVERYFKIPEYSKRKPIHVIISPSWKDKFLDYAELKLKCRKLMDVAGIRGGIVFFHHAGSPTKANGGQWVVRPHFHVICDGWIMDPRKITTLDGWVIKNKGIRKSLFSTVFYLLSHTSVCDSRVSSVWWFGSMGYRAKYAGELKVIDEETHSKCEVCRNVLVEVKFKPTDRPPPQFEGEGFVFASDWEVV